MEEQGESERKRGRDTVRWLMNMLMGSNSFVWPPLPAFPWRVGVGFIPFVVLDVVGDSIAEVCLNGFLDLFRSPLGARWLGESTCRVHTKMILRPLKNLSQSFITSCLITQRLFLAQQPQREHLINNQFRLLRKHPRICFLPLLQHSMLLGHHTAVDRFLVRNGNCVVIIKRTVGHTRIRGRGNGREGNGRAQRLGRSRIRRHDGCGGGQSVEFFA